MTSSTGLVDWRTWVFMKHHQTPERVEAQVRTNTDECSPEFHHASLEGVDRSLILGLQWPHAGYDVPNDFIAEVVAGYAGRAVGLACVDPDDPGAPAEFERSVKKLGLRGLSLAPFGQGFDPYGPGAWQLFEMCQDFGLPIVMNMGIVGYRDTVLDYSNPILVDKVARSFPQLRIIMGHLGHPWIDETISLLGKHPTMVSDLALQYGKKWRFYNTMRLAIDYNVTGQLVFGSDVPFQKPHDAVRSFKGINEWAKENGLPPISESLIDDILYNRPLELVGL